VKDIFESVKEYIYSVLSGEDRVYLKDLAERFGYGDGVLVANGGEFGSCLSEDLCGALNILIGSDGVIYGVDTSKYINLRYGGSSFLNFSIVDMLDDHDYARDSPAFLSTFICREQL